MSRNEAMKYYAAVMTGLFLGVLTAGVLGLTTDLEVIAMGAAGTGMFAIGASGFLALEEATEKKKKADKPQGASGGTFRTFRLKPEIVAMQVDRDTLEYRTIWNAEEERNEADGKRRSKTVLERNRGRKAGDRPVRTGSRQRKQRCGWGMF